MLVRSNRRTEEEILVCLSLKQEERLKFRKGGWVGIKEKRDLEGVWQETKNAKGSRALMEGYQTL